MKLSVIVPCFNVAPYLNRSLMSLVNQTLTDIEIICIDDKSGDGTRELLRDWAKRDLRVRVIENKKNIGAGPGRNLGIDSAAGEYVGFMDPDDYVDEDFFGRLCAAADKTGKQVISGQLCISELNGKKTINPFRTPSALKKSHHNWKFHYTAVYRRDFLNRRNIRYANLSVGEDIIFEALAKCALAPSDFGIARGTFYHYCRRMDSLASDVYDEKKFRDMSFCINALVDIYNNAGVSEKDYICGAHGYFNYLKMAMIEKNKIRNVQLIAADALCEIFHKLQFRDRLRKKDWPLYLALSHRDAGAVRDLIVAECTVKHTVFKLFGFLPFFRIADNIKKKDFRLFGILILRLRIQ
ncbi:MAG: glycosyltransferase family 2 protein [Rickettsiales bacterium]|jgi:glycosyltransferase involved in cell wall biosynthesis|nr:glycosyltransferase family 2 protein [Rickettsiales bacterium]